MRTREWASVDYYEVLGVESTATTDDIVAAFRARAKELHPDARPEDRDADDRFKRCSAAYQVLTSRSRDAYDAYRQALRADPLPVRRTTATTPVRPGPAFSLATMARRTAVKMFVGGCVLLALGIVVVVLVQALRAHDARLRADGRPAVATVVDVDGRVRYQFTTRDGELIRAPAPRKSGAGDAAVGAEVDIRYDPRRPSEIVVDRSTVARDVTLWIVAVKFLLVGAALAGLGGWRLRATGPAVVARRPGSGGTWR